MYSFILHSLFSLISASFEVTVNDKLIFSKLKLGGFPAAEDVGLYFILNVTVVIEVHK